MWSVAVRNGEAVGRPSTVPSDLAGLEMLLGMSPSGTLYTFRDDSKRSERVHADRTAGSSIAEMFPGQAASWSLDGKAIAFLRETPRGLVLVVRHVDSGDERSYPYDNLDNNSPRWLRDGSGLVVRVAGPAHQKTGPAPYFVDAKTGDFRLLFPPNANGRYLAGSAISLDDKTLYGLEKDDPQPQNPFTGIVGVDSATGAVTRVATFPGDGLPSDLGATLVLSPDGATLAVMAAANETDVKNSQARIFTIGVNGSGFREVCGPFRVNRTWDLLRWTPDGRSLLFATAKETKVGWRIMRVPAAGGQPVFDGLDSTNLTGALQLPTLGPVGPFNIDLSPDGSRMSVGHARRPRTSSGRSRTCCRC